MTLHTNDTNRHGALAVARRDRQPRRALVRVLAAATAGTLLATAGACKDSNVPYLTDPTSVSNSPVGVQNAITGLFGASRNDVQYYVIFMSTFARDEANFVSTEPRWVTMGTGVIPISPSDDFLPFVVWDVEFRNAKFADTIIASLSNVAPPYTTPQRQAIVGIAQTMKALNFMMLAETRDTLGVSVASIGVSGTTPAPVLCNKDVWAYIVALLDSANTELDSAGSVALPVSLPSGYAAVSSSAGPSTVQGSFAAFNRALAGKAGLEYAYAFARSSGAAPTPTSAGSPNATALTRADSAIHASALFSPTNLAPPAAGGFAPGDLYGVYHSFSPTSGDLVNPVNGNIGTLATLWDLVADVDTLHDLRWQAKFTTNSNTVQEPSFSGAASPYIYAYAATPSSPIPIVRNEELTLVDAQIQLGLGNYATASTLINDVHTVAGGMSALTIAPTYTAVRDSLMKEQRISTALEASGDRTIAIRMYGLETVSDTTWDATSGPDANAAVTARKAEGGFTDQHTTVLPPPQTEVTGRGGSYTLSCP
jgi:hypothetical protein